MPMYEYRCDACKCEFEELVFGQPESVPCPKCGSVKTHKLLSRCRAKMHGFGPGFPDAPSSGSGRGGGGCSSCSGGNCSTCG